MPKPAKSSAVLPPVMVSPAMVAAGVAVLEARWREFKAPDLVTEIYRAMADAMPPIPVYGTSEVTVRPPHRSAKPKSRR